MSGFPATTSISPTFSGTVTFPDNSTATSAGFTHVGTVTFPGGGSWVSTNGGIASFPDGSTWGTAGPVITQPVTMNQGMTTSFAASGSGTYVLDQTLFAYYAPANRTVHVPFPSVPGAQDGQWYTFLNKGSGTLTLAPSNIININGATSGTFTISITGFTTTTGQNFNVTAAALQTLLSDGTHGPAGTQVRTIGGNLQIFSVYVPTFAVLSANFAGLTGGSPSTTAPPTIDGTLGALVLPPHSGTVFSNDGTNYFTTSNLCRTSNTAVAATVTTPSPVTGTAFTPAANQDCELSFVVTTAATYTVTFGPSTGAENTIINNVALPIGSFFNKRIPAGWKVVITGTIADLGSILAVTC